MDLRRADVEKENATPVTHKIIKFYQLIFFFGYTQSIDPVICLGPGPVSVLHGPENWT